MKYYRKETAKTIERFTSSLADLDGVGHLADDAGTAEAREGGVRPCGAVRQPQVPAHLGPEEGGGAGRQEQGGRRIRRAAHADLLRRQVIEGTGKDAAEEAWESQDEMPIQRTLCCVLRTR